MVQFGFMEYGSTLDYAQLLPFVERGIRFFVEMHISGEFCSDSYSEVGWLWPTRVFMLNMIQLITPFLTSLSLCFSFLL